MPKVSKTAEEQVFVGTQMAERLEQTTHYAGTNKTSIVCMETELFFLFFFFFFFSFSSSSSSSSFFFPFFNPRRTRLMFTCVLARPLCCFHSFNYLYPDLSEGADSVGRQLCGDKECLFSGVTSSGIPCFAGRCRKAMLGACMSD